MITYSWKPPSPLRRFGAATTTRDPDVRLYGAIRAAAAAGHNIPARAALAAADAKVEAAAQLEAIRWADLLERLA